MKAVPAVSVANRIDFPKKAPIAVGDLQPAVLGGQPECAHVHTEDLSEFR